VKELWNISGGFHQSSIDFKESFSSFKLFKIIIFVNYIRNSEKRNSARIELNIKSYESEKSDRSFRAYFHLRKDKKYPLEKRWDLW